LLCYDS